MTLEHHIEHHATCSIVKCLVELTHVTIKIAIDILTKRASPARQFHIRTGILLLYNLVITNIPLSAILLTELHCGLPALIHVAIMITTIELCLLSFATNV